MCLAMSTASGQQGLFQSASGDSSLYLSGQSGVVSYNLGSSAARFDFLRDTGGSFAFGGGAGGTVKADAATLINKNSPAPGGFVEGGLMTLRRSLERGGGSTNNPCSFVNNNDPDITQSGPVRTTAGDCTPNNYLQYVVFQFHYGRSQFYTLPSASEPVPIPTQVNFNQLRGTIAYNGLYKTDPIDLRFGVAYVPGSSNNISDLTQETYQQQVITPGKGGQSILSPSSKTVYVGAYKGYTSQGINADLVFQPSWSHYELGVDVLLRSDLGGGETIRYGSPGIGLYFFKKGSPVVPVGGIAYSYKSGNSQVAISAGWTFGGTTKPSDQKAK